MILLVGCDRRSDRTGPAELETEEIGAGPTDQLTGEDDQKASRRGTGPAGAVPGDFPTGLSLPREASVAEFGTLSESRRYLDLNVEMTPERLTTWLRENWRGWQRQGDSWRSNGVEVRTSITARGAGSRLRIDYPARVVPG